MLTQLNNELPIVTATNSRECTVNVPMAPCPFCGYSGTLHIPAYTACGDDDEMFDAVVECPNCECNGPAACSDMDTFCATRDEARSHAVRQWNTRKSPVITAYTMDRGADADQAE